MLKHFLKLTNNFMQQAQMNFNPCIFDHFIIPDSADWIYELKALKAKKDKQWNIIKNILEKK